MIQKRGENELLSQLESVAKKWKIPFDTETSLWPSVAGLAPKDTPVVCGVGPVARALHTGQEGVSRISLVQRTLLLAEYLLSLN